MTGMPPRNFNPLHFCSARIVTAEERQQWIATAAYYRAQRRGFAPGNECDDWREAEREVDTRMASYL